MDVSGDHFVYSKKYLNGWTPEQEKLMAKWADIAGCYRWLHDKSEKGFSLRNAWFTIPVIIVSTLTGTANFALGSFIPPENIQAMSYAQLGIGAFSIFAGILTTLGNFLRYAQNSEAHRVSSVAWGKLHRQITVELALHPNDREDSMSFLQLCRQDLDSHVEQSPPIPERVINAFEKEFSDVSGLYRPDICHGLEHTMVYNSTKSRMMKIVTDATIYLKQRKKLLRDEILPDLSERISKTVDTELEKRIESKWGDLEKKLLSIKSEQVHNSSFVANTRRFIKRRHNDGGAEAQNIREEIYRDTMYAMQGNNDDHDVIVSIQSETPRSGSQSIAEGSANSATEMVISMTVSPKTPVAPIPAFISIPNTTPPVDVSGSVTTIALAPVDVSGSTLIE
jgi:hypothetical protein